MKPRWLCFCGASERICATPRRAFYAHYMAEHYGKPL